MSVKLVLLVAFVCVSDVSVCSVLCCGFCSVACVQCADVFSIVVKVISFFQLKKDNRPIEIYGSKFPLNTI